jgi:hypothetical protein
VLALPGEANGGEPVSALHPSEWEESEMSETFEDAINRALKEAVHARLVETLPRRGAMTPRPNTVTRAPDYEALAAELAGALALVDDGGDNGWLGDDEATDWSMTGEVRRRINAALARYHEYEAIEGS